MFSLGKFGTSRRAQFLSHSPIILVLRLTFGIEASNDIKSSFRRGESTPGHTMSSPPRPIEKEKRSPRRHWACNEELSWGVKRGHDVYARQLHFLYGFSKNYFEEGSAGRGDSGGRFLGQVAFGRLPVALILTRKIMGTGSYHELAGGKKKIYHESRSIGVQLKRRKRKETAAAGRFLEGREARFGSKSANFIRDDSMLFSSRSVRCGSTDGGTNGHRLKQAAGFLERGTS